MSASFKFFYRYLSLFLTICIFLNLVGVPLAQAAPGEAKRAEQNQVPTAELGEIPDKLPKTKLELTSKRTKYSTRYLNPDGSFTEEIYLEPQYYQDPTDKKWKKIDRMIKNSTAKPGKQENDANDFKTWFANDAGVDELVTIEKDGKSLALIPVQANKVNGSVNSDKITYAGIFPDADVRYQVQGGAVKEDIILHKQSANNTYTFELKGNGVQATTQKDGTIVFSDNKGKKLWYFEKPFMTDTAGKYSDKVTLTLRHENGKTFVDVAADQAFLQSAQYPVTIDPTINSWDILRDMFVASAFPTSSYSSNTYMHTGYNSYFGSTRALIQFYLPSLPSASKISSATFDAYQIQQDATNVSVDLFRINSSWTTTATWNNQPAIASSSEATTTSNAVNTYWQWPMTQLVKDWYSGVQPNYGFMLKQQNESTSPYRTFTSVNNGSNTPKLTINYTIDPMGLEDFWEYTEDGVNVTNGNLVLQENDLTIPGRGVPVSVTRTYNSRKSMVSGIFGYGWFSNVETQLIDAGTGPITLIDSDNTSHIFGQAVGGGYVAHGGVYLTLVKNADNTYTVTQTDGTKINFNTSRQISSIVDTNGNTTSYTYDTNGKLNTIKDASGRTTTFAYGTNGYVSSVTDPANRIIRFEYDTSGNMTKVTNPENKVTTYAYDGTHNLTSITDARNIATTIIYDASDRVTSINRPITIDGVKQTSTTTYSYDTYNLVTTVTDGQNNRVDFSYNANGNIVQITENPLDAVNKSITYFAYDNNNNLIQAKDPNTVKANGPEIYEYTYDANGNITSVKPPAFAATDKAIYTYDSQNNLIKVEDFENNKSNFDFDTKNNQTESTDPIIQTVAQRYDSKGNLLDYTHPMSVADNLAINSSFEFDENGNNWPDDWYQVQQNATFTWSTIAKIGSKSVQISNPYGLALINTAPISYTAGEKYILSGYVKTVGANNARISVRFYDAADVRIGEELAYKLNGDHDWTRIQAVVDNVPTKTDHMRISLGLDAGTGSAYFDAIQLEKGSVLSGYNSVQNNSFEKDTDGNKFPDYWYNSGNLVVNDKLIQNVNPEDDNVYSGTYSFQFTGEPAKKKNIRKHINLSGAANTPFTLSAWFKQVGADPNSNLAAIQVVFNHSDGTYDISNIKYFNVVDGWQHITGDLRTQKAFNSIDLYAIYNYQTGTAWYDGIRLELGASHTVNTYDPNGNYLTSVKDPVGNIVSYNYDAAGNRTIVTDPKGKTTSFAYDKRNLLTSVTDANLKTTSYVYDEVGNRTSMTDANNNLTTYQYNEFNRVSKITNPLTQSIQFGYDKNGNKTKVVFPKGDTVTSTYNMLNRMDGIYYNGVKQWALVYDANGNVSSVTHMPTGKTTSYTNDKNNRVTQIAEGSSNRIDYVYDQNDNLNSFKVTAGTTTVSTGYIYNPLQQVTAVTREGANQAKFVYDDRGNVVSITKGNNTYTTLEYDDANRLKSVKNYNASGALLDSYIYTYDANGNQTSVVTNSGTISYQYDALNQLTQETLTDGTTITYEYDSVGNRTKKAVTQGGNTNTVNYTYDAANKLTAVNGQSFSYDTNGNLTSNGAKTFVYDIENRLIEVKNSSGAVLASYTYNYEGKRTSMTTSSGTIYFHYAGNKVIYETDANNNIVAEYTWDVQGNPVSITKNGNTYYYHINGHGDVTKLTDTAGTVVADYQYDASGNITSQSGSFAPYNPYRYAGYRYDEATGLYYLMARFYDASLGRFITEDSYRGQEDNPLSINSYSYAHNNPVSNIDTTGHYCMSSDARWAHLGGCNNPFNRVQYVADHLATGLPIISNGVITGYVGDARRYNYKMNAQDLQYLKIHSLGQIVGRDPLSYMPGAAGIRGVKTLMTTPQATAAAKALGYTKTSFTSHGQVVYQKGKLYISQDADQHSGGVWKMANSVKNLGSKSTRMGTYDGKLRRIGD